MSFVELILQNKLDEAKKVLFDRLDEMVAERTESAKRYVAADRLEEVEKLEEVARRNTNIIKMGRINKIRRRIRRNAKGRIVVQKNRRRSGIKGYRISGNTVKRIPAMARIQKSRKLKRYWKTKGRAKLNRTLLKRKMSLRRRTSMGIK